MIPIVVLAYNRPRSLERILRSLAGALIPPNVELVISIDGGGDEEVCRIATEFEWSHGRKEVIVHSLKLGMREHSLICVDRCRGRGSVIFLEDDSFVSPFFYSYALRMCSEFAEDKRVMAAALYSFELNEFDGLRFAPVADGADNYFIQSATTWGVVWFEEQWSDFRKWLADFKEINLQKDAILPVAVSNWPSTSWKKYVNRYLVERGRYFSYPRTSLLTNFADPGVHFSRSITNYQVPLAMGESKGIYFGLDQSRAIYDAFLEYKPRHKEFYCMEGSVEFDLRNIKDISQLQADYIYTTRNVKDGIKSYGLDLYPFELNILLDVPGSDIVLARRSDVENSSKRSRAAIVRSHMKDLGRRAEVALVMDRIRGLLFSSR